MSLEERALRAASESETYSHQVARDNAARIKQQALDEVAQWFLTIGITPVPVTYSAESEDRRNRRGHMVSTVRIARATWTSTSSILVIRFPCEHRA